MKPPPKLIFGAVFGSVVAVPNTLNPAPPNPVVGIFKGYFSSAFAAPGKPPIEGGVALNKPPNGAVTGLVAVPGKPPNN